MTKKLAGRKILITGAASGMGRAIAELFAAEGAALALLDINDAPLQELVRSITASESSALARGFRCDVSRGEQVTSAVGSAASYLGGIDGVVNAAGVLIMKPFAELDTSSLQQMLSVNLVGPFTIVRAALESLRVAPASTVVNVASVSAFMPMPGSSAYSASKAGLVMLTKGMALELGPKIRCNAICPGTVRTEMTRYIWQNPEHAQRAADRAALKRIGDPEEVARAALFLTSADSSFTTGTALTVDGGFCWH